MVSLCWKRGRWTEPRQDSEPICASEEASLKFRLTWDRSPHLWALAAIRCDRRLFTSSFPFQLIRHAQGRSLLRGDHIALGDCSPKVNEDTKLFSLPINLIPLYPDHWIIYVLSGPHDDEEFITKEGISEFYSTKWRISPSSNRLGIRLESPTSSEKIHWARTTGGEGGSHPSNILDNGYAFGTINVNGDTPVILSTEGPDMGGYLCLCTIATAER